MASRSGATGVERGRRAESAGGGRPLVVAGGIHGDEPSGARALTVLATEGIATCGPCNPWGLARGRRSLADGRDLNRSFARDDCAEAERVRAGLRAHPPGLLLDLHEDGRARLPYLIQYGPDDDVGERLVAALGGPARFQARPRFGPATGAGGVLRPSRALLLLVGASRWWPLVYWVYRTFGATACVVEVPARWPMAERVGFHCAMARAARDAMGASTGDGGGPPRSNA